MAVPKSASITFRTFTSTFFTMHVLYIIYIIRMKVKVIRISKLSTGIYIYFFLFKAKRVEAKPPHKFGESTFETMPKDASREIEKTLKYFIK